MYGETTVTATNFKFVQEMTEGPDGRPRKKYLTTVRDKNWPEYAAGLAEENRKGAESRRKFLEGKVECFTCHGWIAEETVVPVPIINARSERTVTYDEAPGAVDPNMPIEALAGEAHRESGTGFDVQIVLHICPRCARRAEEAGLTLQEFVRG